MVKVTMKKISIMSVNFLKVIFNDKSQSTFRTAVQIIPFFFSPLLLLQHHLLHLACIAVFWVSAVEFCFGFGLSWRGCCSCDTVFILHDHINFPFWFAWLYCITTVKWRNTFFVVWGVFYKEIQLGNLQFT